MTKRATQWISLAILAVAAGCGAQPQTRSWQVHGVSLGGELDRVDLVMRRFMQQRDIPAGALAVTYQGRLVLAKGFRWGAQTDRPVRPDSLFRIASLSKPITAAAIFCLVEQGRLDLDEKVAEILDLAPPPGRKADPRIGRITVRHLLQHLGGWDRNAALDPMFAGRRIARALHRPLPVGIDDIIHYMSGQPLQHDPGTVMAYSNYGYCLLGRVIERRSGRSYQRFVLDRICAPLGMTGMRLARSRPADRAPGEVEYVASNGESPYGITIENMDAHGGWLASVVDLARFAAAFDEPQRCPILSAESIGRMFALPAHLDPVDVRPGEVYYACGWNVRDFGDGRRNTWHTGSLPGTTAFMARWRSGINCVVLFNKRDEGYRQIDPILSETLHAIGQWPTGDLFDLLTCPVATPSAGAKAREPH